MNLLETLGAKFTLYNAYEEEMLFDQPRFQHALSIVYMDIIAILVKTRQKATKNRTFSFFDGALPQLHQ